MRKKFEIYCDGIKKNMRLKCDWNMNEI